MKYLTTLISLVLYVPVLAQRYDTRTYNIIGLADGDEISDCLSKGIPFLLVGLTILLICIKHTKQAAEREQRRKRVLVGMFEFGTNRYKHSNNVTVIGLD